MQLQEYLLAIVIPSWNCCQYIPEMLDSILANTFTNWKCYVVDDGSTDGTLEVLEHYSKRDNRIVFISRNRLPKGAQTCRNIGYSLALKDNAKYIIWFDADDMISQCCLGQRVNYMENHKNLDFSIFPAKTFVSNPTEILDTTKIYGIKYGPDPLRDMLKWCLPMVGWTNIYKMESLYKYELTWDENLLSMQDSDFNISALIKGMKYEFAWNEGGHIDYFYRLIQTSNANISSKINNVEHLCSHFYLINKILSNLSGNQLSLYKRELECYIYRFAKFFCHDKKLYLKLLNIPWINKNFRFRYSLLVYRWFHLYYPFQWKRTQICTFFMLNHLERDWDMFQQDWSRFMFDKLNIILHKRKG